MSHRPYRMPMPRSLMAWIVAFSSGLVGSSSSTSTAACDHYCQQPCFPYHGVRDVRESYRLVVEGTDKSITVAIFSGCNGGFRLDNGVDTTNYCDC